MNHEELRIMDVLCQQLSSWKSLWRHMTSFKKELNSCSSKETQCIPSHHPITDMILNGVWKYCCEVYQSYFYQRSIKNVFRSKSFSRSCFGTFLMFSLISRIGVTSDFIDLIPTKYLLGIVCCSLELFRKRFCERGS